MLASFRRLAGTVSAGASVLAIGLLISTAIAHADGATLSRAFDLAAHGDARGAEALKSGLDRVEQKLVDWMLIRVGVTDLPATRITEFAITNASWPDPELFRRRAEQALERERPGPEIVIQAFQGSRPYSDRGRLMLARAYLALGKTAEAREEIRGAWLNDKLTDADEATIASEFASLLTPADYKARLDLALLTGQTSDALRIARHISSEWIKLAEARMAIEKKKGDAAKLFAALPSSLTNEPAYLFGRAQLARRQEHWDEAAQILIRAPKDPRAMVVPDQWWEEKRIVSRKILDMGNAKLAYQIVNGHLGSTPAVQAEAEFHAGWYALRFLNQPGVALKHFAKVAEASGKPVTRARAFYWMGRAAEAGANGSARDYYARSAEFGFTFYGQMSRAKLGMTDLGLSRTVTPTSADRTAIERDDRFAALAELIAIGRKDLAETFFRYMAETLPTAGQTAVLIDMAERQGWYNFAVMAGKAASQRGLDMQALAFPVKGLPGDIDTSGLEKALAFAITRQESEFNQADRSSAGAVGIFQVMPDTGRDAAKMLKIPYDANAWRTDPRYNVRLGTAYVNNLVKNYDGNYVMAIAGYNAGPGRIHEWVQAYGDPRTGQIDIVDWMERIPFSETRNYVQRVLENLQVYRFRLEGKRLMIAEDLKRGVGIREATGTIGTTSN
ncbi:MAG: lytic transglycosylase domain-containing protein [Ancalomicrobiaceae bacterium]|nr:lytic transglycosylase domain-containing protein [Ancalomicrobiaceae bacterium]